MSKTFLVAIPLQQAFVSTRKSPTGELIEPCRNPALAGLRFNRLILLQKPLKSRISICRNPALAGLRFNTTPNALKVCIRGRFVAIPLQQAFVSTRLCGTRKRQRGGMRNQVAIPLQQAFVSTRNVKHRGFHPHINTPSQSRFSRPSFQQRRLSNSSCKKEPVAIPLQQAFVSTFKPI